jgi:PAS domain S-box-containing protein
MLSDFGSRSQAEQNPNLASALQMARQFYEQQASLHLLLEVSQDIIWEYHPSTGQVLLPAQFHPDGTHKPKPISLRRFWRLVHPEDRNRAFEVLRAYLLGHSNEWRAELRLRGKAQSYRWLEFRGIALFGHQRQLLHFVGSCQDLSDAKMLSAQLRLAQRRFQASFEHAYHGIFLADVEGLIMLANSALEDLLNEDGLPGLSLTELTHPEDVAALRHTLHQLRGSAETSDSHNARTQITLRLGTQAPSWVRVSLTCTHDTAQRTQFLVGHVEDLRELREAQEIALQSAKLATIGETAASLAHELRAPLSAIRLKAESGLELHTLMTPELYQKKLSEIVRIVDKTDEILQHMRDFSRRSDTEQRQARPLDELIDEVMLLCKSNLTQLGIRTQIEIPKDLPRLSCNAVQLEQVFTNLINNARDAMEGRAQRRLTLRGFVEQGELCVSVADTGHGISPEIQKQLFQSFFTTKERGKGTGLGLTIVSRIVEEHGGRITMQSVEGEGTTFVLHFPLTNLDYAN